jgi:hypothetical protein
MFPVIGVGLWVVVCFFVARSGWERFARKYRSNAKKKLKLGPVEKVHDVPKMGFRIGRGWYRYMVRVILTEEGIYFRAILPFRLFHSPFLLPWSSVRSVEKRRGYFVEDRYLVEVVDAEDTGSIELYLPAEAGEELQKYWRSGHESGSESPVGSAGGED